MHGAEERREEGMGDRVTVRGRISAHRREVGEVEIEAGTRNTSGRSTNISWI